MDKVFILIQSPTKLFVCFNLCMTCLYVERVVSRRKIFLFKSGHNTKRRTHVKSEARNI